MKKHRKNSGTASGSGFFFSCDWGTSNFRLRLVRRKDLKVVHTVAVNKGVSVIAGEQDGSKDGLSLEERYARFFSEQIERFRDHLDGAQFPPAVASGMAASSIGWRELPYSTVPFSLEGTDVRSECVRAPLEGGAEVTVRLVSGLRAGQEIMRGEETEIIGLYGLPQWREEIEGAVIVMPGTHSKHVWIRRGCIADFQTFMTGELFELLATRSILRHSVTFPGASGSDVGTPGEPENSPAFCEGLETSSREGLSRALFRTRTNSLFKQYSTPENTWFLYGLLVGAEIRELIEICPRAPLLLAASHKFGPFYRKALGYFRAGERLKVIPGDDMDEAILRAHALYLSKRS